MRQNIANLVQTYVDNAKADGINNPPGLRSEGASLPWGGLFDIKKNWKHLPEGHCGHRDGRTLDLSLSTFSGYSIATTRSLRKSLEQAVKQAGFAFTYVPESPSTPRANHWHIQMK